MKVSGPNRGQSVQICQEPKLVYVAPVLFQLGSNVIEATEQINTLGEIPLRGVPKVINRALPFEQRAEKLQLLQGRVPVQRHRLEARKGDRGLDGRRWCGRDDAPLKRGEVLWH